MLMDGIVMQKKETGDSGDAYYDFKPLNQIDKRLELAKKVMNKEEVIIQAETHIHAIQSKKQKPSKENEIKEKGNKAKNRHERKMEGKEERERKAEEFRKQNGLRVEETENKGKKNYLSRSEKKKIQNEPHVIKVNPTFFHS